MTSTSGVAKTEAAERPHENNLTATSRASSTPVPCLASIASKVTAHLAQPSRPVASQRETETPLVVSTAQPLLAHSTKSSTDPSRSQVPPTTTRTPMSQSNTSLSSGPTTPLTTTTTLLQSHTSLVSGCTTPPATTATPMHQNHTPLTPSSTTPPASTTTPASQKHTTVTSSSTAQVSSSQHTTTSSSTAQVSSNQHTTSLHAAPSPSSSSTGSSVTKVITPPATMFSNNPPRAGAARPLSPTLPVPRVQARAADQGVVIKWTFSEEGLSKQGSVIRYELYAHVSSSKPESLPPLDQWGKVGDIKPMSLPMAVTLTNFAKGQYYSFSVRAFFPGGRLSEYSEPRTVVL